MSQWTRTLASLFPKQMSDRSGIIAELDNLLSLQVSIIQIKYFLQSLLLATRIWGRSNKMTPIISEYSVLQQWIYSWRKLLLGKLLFQSVFLAFVIWEISSAQKGTNPNQHKLKIEVWSLYSSVHQVKR